MVSPCGATDGAQWLAAGMRSLEARMRGTGLVFQAHGTRPEPGQRKGVGEEGVDSRIFRRWPEEQGLRR